MVRICPDGPELHTVIRVAARERHPNGAMAQLVARFHGMEEVGGSNPPSSTTTLLYEPVPCAVRGFFEVS